MAKYYYVQDDDCEIEVLTDEVMKYDTFEFEYDGWDAIDWLVTDIAKDFYGEHDGWECSWPLKFSVWDENKNFKGHFEVDVEYEPTFYLRKQKHKPDKEGE